MGTNSKTSYHCYVVAPTAAVQPSPVAEPLPEHDSALVDPVLLSVCEQDTSDLDPEELSAAYGTVQTVTAEVQQAIATEQDAALAAAADSQLKTALAQFLGGLTPFQLQQLAAEHGFQYPQLVGLSGSTTHPLVHWLDPTYPQDCESKKKIQAVAQARFDALCAGETVAGKTLADWSLSPVAAVQPVGFTPWQAAPSDVVGAQADLATALTALAADKTDEAPAVAAVIAAENKLATALCSELGDQLPAAVAAARHQVSQALGHLTRSKLAAAADAAIVSGTVTTLQTATLGPSGLLVLLRASSSADDRENMQQLSSVRVEQLAMYSKATAATDVFLGPESLALPSLDCNGATSVVSTFLAAVGNQLEAGEKISSWGSKAVHPHGNPQPPPTATLISQATASINSWAHQQHLADLRDFAAQEGLGDLAAAATKSQLVAYLTDTVVANHASGAAGTQAAAKLTSLTDTLAAKKTSPTSQPSQSTACVPPAPSSLKTGTPRSFGAQHAQLVAALEHASASQAALPPRVPSEQVASWTFGPGTPAKLGGAHPKTLHTGPDGSSWMFKPDQRGGALAHAEAAASAAMGRVSLPCIPVYATTIDGKPGSVQPLMAGTTTVSTNPTSWSQADVDAIVRLHVAAWTIGDHDLHPGNVLRTPGGGLVPVDAGQAFKHYGKDRLGLDYHPNSTYGTPPPIYQQAYQAALHGGLEPGVTVNPAVAHPVIKQFEAIPDAEWRAMLHQTAYHGAKSDQVDWVPAMRARAAKAHGVPESAVSTAQIAEAFLDHAVQRKNNLRNAFASFFTKELKLPAGAALTHMGGK